MVKSVYNNLSYANIATMKQHIAEISDSGVIISFSRLLFDIAFVNVLNDKYTEMIQTTTNVKTGLLKTVIIATRSRTEIDAKVNIPIATRLIILILAGSFSYFPP